MTTETITIEFDRTAPPVATKTYPRMVITYWAIDPAATPDTFDCTPHAKLTVDHAGGRYEAVLTEVSAGFTANVHRELVLSAARPRRIVVATEPAARFGAKRFAAFAAAALAAVTAAGAS